MARVLPANTATPVPRGGSSGFASLRLDRPVAYDANVQAACRRSVTARSYGSLAPCRIIFV
jgi:hypothetical protein